MQKLLWIGSPFFSGSLEACGWNVCAHNFEDTRIFSYKDLVSIAGFEPDVLVVADKSRAPFVIGMEKFPCLTVFYSVDSHIHSWHPLYAQGFDVCIASLRDHLPKFSGPYLAKENVWWSPAFAKDKDQPDPSADKLYDCLFVGSNSAEIMPKRARFLADLTKEIPNLKITSGDYLKLFPQGRVLVNQAEHGDLNFRVFEAMGCGGCLVTPRIGHGLPELFIDGEHFVNYVPHDAGDAAFRIKFLLEHPDLIEYIGQTAYAEINARHRAIHRAITFTDKMCDLAERATELISRRLRRSDEIHSKSLSLLYLLWAKEEESPDIKKIYLEAAKGKFGLDGIIG